MADKPKLTRAERKQIEAVIRKYRGDGKPHTAQDTIPYQIMYPDGICYLGNRRYSQSIEFFDINYLLAQPDDQTAIFEYLCDLYNYLDSSIHVQFTYPNRKSDREQLARSFEMPPCNDGLDPIRQEQLFFNLLGTAVKFTPEGGEISYRVSNYAVHSGTFSADYVVADTGIGMSREFQKLLFEPFTQERRDEAERRHGSGLGLAITQICVQQLGGSIAVTSAIGEGTKVKVHLDLPLADIQPQ